MFIKMHLKSFEWKRKMEKYFFKAKSTFLKHDSFNNAKHLKLNIFKNS